MEENNISCEEKKSFHNENFITMQRGAYEHDGMNE
jgi:hypothetical protein